VWSSGLLHRGGWVISSRGFGEMYRLHLNGYEWIRELQPRVPSKCHAQISQPNSAATQTMSFNMKRSLQLIKSFSAVSLSTGTAAIFPLD